MGKKLKWVASEAALIFMAAIIGTFTWNHGSIIFNNNSPSKWFVALCADMGKYPLAWIFFAVLVVFLFGVLCYRAINDDDIKGSIAKK